ncbi:16S rRNA (guanine(966)-N(2))-methyltransferase RsmD [Catenisphaera adipataccumulans]|uniref:16S rRNA (Guanine966-N2)-methyltransferase n=1 Tax=Catenisphaera adipataccumulans TaxID=700500 RepID=A0A7W8CUT0_9FIRM|nr:16S rRNA (guanine(966)-N(2))-methyltransferase RsmD [Catenisphaera adipataccumulans]MBB5182031.1 16S rRNA (guanine966-N2)-methyltransferase [Catenisphaera adipataccumulans]
MRIIAGKYRSRRLESVPGQATRPTADKIKGAVFSSLGPISGRFLDCYAGTGNMALEALSRGMDHVVLVDRDRKAVRTIKKNIASLQAQDACEVYQGDIFMILPQLPAFDVVYIDPPYAKQRNVELLAKLSDHVADKGRVVIESLPEDVLPERCSGFVKYKEKTYRACKITYYRKEGTE